MTFVSIYHVIPLQISRESGWILRFPQNPPFSRFFRFVFESVGPSLVLVDFLYGSANPCSCEGLSRISLDFVVCRKSNLGLKVGPCPCVLGLPSYVPVGRSSCSRCLKPCARGLRRASSQRVPSLSRRGPSALPTRPALADGPFAWSSSVHRSSIHPCIVSILSLSFLFCPFNLA